MEYRNSGTPSFMDLPVRVLGLDLAANNCGWCLLVYNHNGIDRARSESGRIVGLSRGFVDIASMVQHIDGYLLSGKFPTMVAIEDLINSPFSYSGGDLSQSAGAMKYAMHLRKMTYLLVHPSKVKSFVLPSKGSKWQVSTAAMTAFDWMPNTTERAHIQDEMDAVTIAHIGMDFYLLKKGLTTLDKLPEHRRAIFHSATQRKIRKGKEIIYETGLLQRTEFLVRGEPDAIGS